MDNALLFLLKLAWDSRFKLPLLITIGFMMLDIRIQLEVTVESRRVRRIRPAPIVIPVGTAAQGRQQENVSDSNDVCFKKTFLLITFLFCSNRFFK